MGPYAKPMEGQELLSFLFGGGRKKLRVVLICIFGRDLLSPRTAIFLGTVDALIKAPLKNNYNPQRRLVWSAKNYFGPLGAPCLERRLSIRAQLAPFQ